jgi:hypothetical protein
MSWTASNDNPFELSKRRRALIWGPSVNSGGGQPKEEDVIMAICF